MLQTILGAAILIENEPGFILSFITPVLIVLSFILSLSVLHLVGRHFIGKPMARKSLKIWRENLPHGGSGGIWGLVLFPLSFANNEVGNPDDETFAIFRAKFDNKGVDRCYDVFSNEFEDKYITFSSSFWMLRILWGVLIGTIIFMGDMFMGFQKLRGKSKNDPEPCPLSG